jgi:hypothetical protein
MAFRPEHEIHARRFGRNLGVALLLAAFVALVFALTVVKLMRGEPLHSQDYGSDRAATLPVEEKAP